MKDFFKKIKEFREKPNGNAILFFSFYFIFFVVVILLLRFSSSKRMLPEYYEKSNTNYIDSDTLSDNYSYKYTVLLDENEYLIIGKRYKDTELFKFNSLDYYKNGDNYFINNTIWLKTDNPNKYYGFFSDKNIVKLINSSTYENKTDYESGKVVYSFLISTDTINKIVNNIETDNDDLPNRIEITIDDNNITKIVYNLNSYCISNNICTKKLKIEALYDDIDNIEEIDNPISG